MGRRYRRSSNYRRSGSYRSSGKVTPFGALFAVALLAYALLREYWPVILGIVAVAAIIVFFVIYRKKNNPETEPALENVTAMPAQNTEEAVSQQVPTYSAKVSLMTDCEKAFFETISKIIGTNYHIQPQINLASVVNKETQGRYQNELFRNIDFGVFDSNYSLLLLIEINDQTHTQKNRIERDNKVKAICDEAGIPLVTFWTKYGINEQYIRSRLAQYLPLIEAPPSEEKASP